MELCDAVLRQKSQKVEPEDHPLALGLRKQSPVGIDGVIGGCVGTLESEEWQNLRIVVVVRLHLSNVARERVDILGLEAHQSTKFQCGTWGGEPRNHHHKGSAKRKHNHHARGR